MYLPVPAGTSKDIGYASTFEEWAEQMPEESRPEREGKP
jgi:hypothetical protein